MLRKITLPLQLLLVIFGVLLFGQYVTEPVARSFFTFSTIFKEFLRVFLPFIITSFVLSGILSFKKNAPIVLSLLVGIILCSNALIALISYVAARLTLPYITAGISTKGLVVSQILTPFFTFQIPFPVSSEQGLMLAVILGMLFSFVSWPAFEKQVHRFKDRVEGILSLVFIPLLPLYVLGFLLKIQYEGVFSNLFNYYGRAFLLILCLQWTYLALMYFVATGFNVMRAIIAIQNAIPSYLAAFTTMSSTAAIPITVNSAENNEVDSSFAKLSVPIMANVHLIGDGISTPILALVTLYVFAGTIPSLFTYAIFVAYFCVTMLAVSGIPGGGIIVMIPILVSRLGFTGEMVSVIMTLYMLQDSLGTAGNVMGDGALAIIMNKLLKKMGIVV